MIIEQRIISEIYDTKEDKVLKRVIIKRKNIANPESIDDVGYNQGEQVSTLQRMQDEFLEAMAKHVSFWGADHIVSQKWEVEWPGIKEQFYKKAA
jgi:hypothetical protein